MILFNCIALNLMELVPYYNSAARVVRPQQATLPFSAAKPYVLLQVDDVDGSIKPR